MPSSAAIRVARNFDWGSYENLPRETVAAMIDRETGLPDLVATLRGCDAFLRYEANEAGDVPDWNEGGKAYELAEQVKAALAKVVGK